jgi:K+-sensing histidine kinase KdpD
LAWLLGLVGSALILAVCLLLDAGSNVTALCLFVPIGAASAVGGRTIGWWVAGIVGVVYAVALLTPFGHLRFGLTHDMVVLGTFLAVATVVGTVADRRRPAPLPPSEDPAVLLNAVSHDLRRPLSTIRAASSDLLSGAHASEPERQAELLGLVMLESERLDRIVGNLLSAGRAQSGRLEPQVAPESPAILLHRSVGRLGQLHPQELVVRADPDLPEVLVDEVQIDQVLSNLVEDAARAAPADSTITLTASADDGMVVFSVADEGPGFGTLADDPFEAYLSAAGSSGLGLAICKAIVTAHGGTIDVGDVRGGSGACVHFTVPVDSSSAR